MTCSSVETSGERAFARGIQQGPEALGRQAASREGGETREGVCDGVCGPGGRFARRPGGRAAEVDGGCVAYGEARRQAGAVRVERPVAHHAETGEAGRGFHIAASLEHRDDPRISGRQHCAGKPPERHDLNRR